MTRSCDHLSALGEALVFTDKLEVRPSRIAGRGLFANDTIGRRAFLGEYTGRRSEWHPRCFVGDYTMRFGRELRNARHGGNNLRYINHCGDAKPNVVAVGFLFFAAERIGFGDELVMDYGWDFPADPTMAFDDYDFAQVVRTVLQLGIGTADLEYIYSDAAFAMLEHLLHEVGHAISLELPVELGLSANVGTHMEKLPQQMRTANEATVLVATMRALDDEAFAEDYSIQAKDQGVEPRQWLDALEDLRGDVAVLKGKLADFMREHSITRSP